MNVQLTKAGTSDAPVLNAISKHAFDSDVEVGAPAAGGPPGYMSLKYHMKMARSGHLFKLTENGLIIGGAILFPDGDTLNIGRHTLSFVQMPMVHWPDSMMTYVADEKLLFPNDGFGQHYACDGLFDDGDFDIIMDEAKKYYGNIVWPYGMQVQKVLEEAAKLDIDMIAPSHGVIWRDHIPEIVEKYKLWFQ